MIRPPNAGDAFFVFHGAGINVERIVFDDLFCLLRRNSMPENMIAVFPVPVKNKIGFQWTWYL